ncbi:hypothetical protein R3I93_022385 [Phoxinus phoxinus]|uniref:long-chain-fatty-acid--CoA ligase n=1 Tax=Phoxinus phoxinus TaxID=58324 RepID=A0AAN9C3S6_9TELE
MFWFFVSAVILLFALKYRYPYLIKEAKYIYRVALIVYRMTKYFKSKPFYTLVDRFLDSVQKNPHKAFIRFQDQTYSYAQSDKQSNKIARSLLKHADLHEGDTVALLFGNEPMFLWICLALAKIGCSAALLNHNIRSKSLLHCFSCCEARVLIAGAELQDAVEEVLPALREQGISVYILTDHVTSEGMKSLTDKIKQASDEPVPADLRANVSFNSPAAYIYTSGTTGLPKAAVITHRRLWVIASFQSMCGVTSDDVVYVCLPLYHSAGFGIGFGGAIERGATVVLKSKFSSSQFWDDCRKYNVTVMQYIGETMRYLCNTPKKDNDRDHKVKIAIGNGVRADVWKDFLNRFGRINVRELYAATEGNVGFINYTDKVGVVGRINIISKVFFPFALIKFDIEKEEPVRNTEGLCIPVGRDEVGLLVGKITKHTPFVGYAGNKQQTEKKRLSNVFVKGDLYFNSGDLLRIDNENFVYFQDRVGDTFRWKGENVATTEVADILMMMDCIEEANVYGVKVEGHEGRIGMAAVKLKEGRELDCVSICSVLANYLPVYARPRFIRIQNSLEVTGTFKMKKVKLVEEGFDPTLIQDPLYFLDLTQKKYIPLSQETHNSIMSHDIKL